jgi:hypothetical protein
VIAGGHSTVDELARASTRGRATKCFTSLDVICISDGAGLAGWGVQGRVSSHATPRSRRLLRAVFMSLWLWRPGPVFGFLPFGVYGQWREPATGAAPAAVPSRPVAY